MSLLTLSEGSRSVFFDDAIVEAGQKLHDQYRAAQPFPHIVIDDFLPESVLEDVRRDFPEIEGDRGTWQRDHEFRKRQIPPDGLAPGLARSLFYAFNAQPFVDFLEALTGIEKLLPDPTFAGGGFHETLTGGHLGIHADFNVHQGLNLKRRLNAILFLNRDWQPGYGGELELWEKDMSGLAKSVAPVFNRCVIFDVEDDSFHGHPEPLTTPEHVSRRSIALYYYTASDAILREHRLHTTNFQPRKGTGDRIDVKVATRTLLHDWMPPALLRALRKLRRSG